jgi:hypothetical protein
MNRRTWSLSLALMILALLAACGVPASPEPEDGGEPSVEEQSGDGPVTDAPAAPPTLPPDLTETALWHMVEASETAGAIQTATATALAAAETATEQARVDAAATQNLIYVAETETAAAIQTAEAARTLTIEDPANDGLDCRSGEAVDAMQLQDDLATLILSSDGQNMVVTAQYAEPDAEAAMRAASLLYAVTVGVTDPAKPLPAEDPANPYAAAANVYFQAAWFLPANSLNTLQAAFDQGQWTTVNTVAGMTVTLGATVQALIPLNYFPAEGKLLVGVARDNRVCDYAGLSVQKPYRPLIDFVITDGGVTFSLETE